MTPAPGFTDRAVMRLLDRVRVVSRLTEVAGLGSLHACRATLSRFRRVSSRWSRGIDEEPVQKRNYGGGDCDHTGRDKPRRKFEAAHTGKANRRQPLPLAKIGVGGETAAGRKFGPADRSNEMTGDYEQELIEWAHNYKAYERFASIPDRIEACLAPLIEEWERNRRIPEWAGVDLLRAWAFYCVRSHHFDDWQPLLVAYPQVGGIAEAIRNPPAARKSDMPPPRAD